MDVQGRRLSLDRIDKGSARDRGGLSSVCRLIGDHVDRVEHPLRRWHVGRDLGDEGGGKGRAGDERSGRAGDAAAPGPVGNGASPRWRNAQRTLPGVQRVGEGDACGVCLAIAGDPDGVGDLCTGMNDERGGPYDEEEVSVRVFVRADVGRPTHGPHLAIHVPVDAQGCARVAGGRGGGDVIVARGGVDKEGVSGELVLGKEGAAGPLRDGEGGVVPEHGVQGGGGARREADAGAVAGEDRVDDVDVGRFGGLPVLEVDGAAIASAVVDDGVVPEARGRAKAVQRAAPRGDLVVHDHVVDDLWLAALHVEPAPTAGLVRADRVRFDPGVAQE